MSENVTLAASLGIYVYTLKNTHVKHIEICTVYTHSAYHTHPGLKKSFFSSYERSQRLLSLRSNAEYLTINYSWKSDALIFEP